jgi:hypothetical protein
MYGFREALSGQGFTEIQTPKIVGTATESGANVFALDYFGGPAYLAQSPQFYKQTMVGVFERVFEVGPVFRAEPHDTVRHLAEYVSLDAEFGFITDHRDVLAVLRSTVAGMLSAVGERAAPALERLGVALPEIPVDVPVVHFSEALKIAGADPDEPVDRHRPDLPVADLPGASGGGDDVDHLVGVGRVDQHFELDLGHEAQGVLRTPEDLGLPSLTAEPLHLADSHADDASAPQRLLHVLETVRFDDGGDEMDHCASSDDGAA